MPRIIQFLQPSPLTLLPQELSKGFFQTGDDGYVGPYTDCKDWDKVKDELGDAIQPMCSIPKRVTDE